MVTILRAGTEVQVNTTTVFSQSAPSITTLINGDYVVTWTSQGQDGSLNGIFGQVFSSSGIAIGSEFQVNTTTTNDQVQPFVGALSTGGFAVTWTGFDVGALSYGNHNIFLQRFDALYQPQGAETEVIPAYNVHEYQPTFVELPDGRIVVTWTSIYDSFNSYSPGVFVQRYLADGTPEGTATLINTFANNQQSSPEIAVQSDGSYVVVWQSNQQDEPLVTVNGYVTSYGSQGIYAQRYDIDGNPLGFETRVNTTIAGDQISPKVVALNWGGYVITWRGNGSAGNGHYAQAYDQGGNPTGVESLIATIPNQPFDVSLAALSGGGYVVVFGQHTGGSLSIFAQRYDASGNAVGGPALVSGANGNSNISVTAIADDGFIVSWASSTTGSGSAEIVTRTFTVNSNTDLLPGVDFADGTGSADIFTVAAGGLNAGDFVKGLAGHDIINFTGGGVNTAVGATLDSIEEIQLTNATGTTLTVNNVAQAMLVTTATGAADALIVNSGTLTVAQRRALFDLGVESLSDAQGTYLSTNAAPVTVADTAVGNEDGTLISNVVQNDSDANGDTLTVVPGSIVVTGFTPSAGLVLPVNGGPVIDIASLQSHFVTSGTSIVFNPGVNGHSFQFLDSGQSITVTMTYDVTDSVSNVTQSTLTFTINGANEVLNLNEWADFLTQGFTDLRFGDNIFGNGGDDVIYAMSGNDLISGGTGDDMLYGGDGNDTVGGGDDDDFVSGGSGNDILRGAAGDDRLEGGSGDDNLTGGAGADQLFGGTGVDTASYSVSATGVYVDFENHVAMYGEAEGDTLVNIENLTGSNFNDVLIGSVADNSLLGKGGADEIYGRGGVDTIDGDSGDDRIEGGAGGDSLNGGFGTDELSYSQSSTGVTVNLGSGAASGGDADGDSFMQFENLRGSGFVDVLTGDAFTNIIYAGSGDDTASGNGGDDQLLGEGGNDTLSGGQGNDKLVGGAGDDLLNGGAGNDQFIYQAGAFGTDTISGWTDGQDQIFLTGSGLSFASFTVSQVGTATHLVSSDGTIILNATLAGSVDVSDFVV